MPLYAAIRFSKVRKKLYVIAISHNGQMSRHRVRTQAKKELPTFCREPFLMS